jgi:hypothetical protein
VKRGAAAKLVWPENILVSVTGILKSVETAIAAIDIRKGGVRTIADMQRDFSPRR